jgi:conjugal transfer pilus assembly protein TraE
MLLSKLMADVEARGGVTRAFQMILGASLLTNVFMAGAFFTMDRTVRTILAPPEISKSFWVDGRTLSPEYLEQMGSWVIQQYATVTPSSIDYQSNMLLKYVHPSIHGDLAIRFKIGSNRLKADNMSKIFMPREIRISEKGQSVALIGAQSTWIADKRVPNDEMKAYLVTFDYDGSRTFIKELRETSPLKPFDPPVAQANAEVEAAMQQEAAAQAAAAQAAAAQATGSQTAATAPLAPSPSPVGGAGLPPAPQASNPAAKDALQSGVTPTTPNSR